MNEELIEKHRQRHLALHTSLDEIAADFSRITGKFLSDTTVMELIQWSSEQTKQPTLAEGEKYGYN